MCFLTLPCGIPNDRNRKPPLKQGLSKKTQPPSDCDCARDSATFQVVLLRVDFIEPYVDYPCNALGEVMHDLFLFRLLPKMAQFSSVCQYNVPINIWGLTFFVEYTCIFLN
jgi:hypothetical protein